MPNYEVSLILRQMTKPEQVSILKRLAQSIFQRDGVIRKLENIGDKPLPHKISNHGNAHRRGSYFLFNFDLPPTSIEDMNEEWGRDIDVLRRFIKRKDDKETIECSLEDELLPPAYRSDVKAMIETARTSKKFKQEQKRIGWNWNTGLEYYPFQK